MKKRKTKTRQPILYLVSVFLICISLLLVKSTVWAADSFETQPSVFDDARQDNVFSPNNDGEQDRAIIRFSVENAEEGFDYRITVNTYGAGFDVDSDWNTGVRNSHTSPVEVEWNGTSADGTKVDDGRYEVLVEVDKTINGNIIQSDRGYDSAISIVYVDTTYPQVSASTDIDSFSPNGDGIKDSINIIYILSEMVIDLSLNIEQFSSIELEGHEPETKYSYQWNGTWYGREGGTKFEDGTYSLELVGTDKGGNRGSFQLTVTIDTEVPDVEETFLQERDFINTPITEVSAILDDKGGTPIDFDTSLTVIELRDFNGREISGTTKYEEDVNRVILRLKQPLGTIEQNGEYSMIVNLADEAGNRKESIQSFILDTQPPEIKKVTGGESELKPYNYSTVLPESGSIVIQSSDATSGIDFSDIQVNLLNPAGGSVNFTKTITLIENNLSIKLDYQGLQQEGRYTINIVSLPDRAGNKIENDTRYRFRYVISPEELPAVLSTVPANGSMVSTQISSISAVLEDNSGTGLDLTETSISFTGPGGDVLGTKRIQVPDTVQFSLSSPLNTDGTDDGRYEVIITPVDNLGQVGNPKKINFTYDTLEPELVSLTPVDINKQESYVNIPVESISAVFSEEGSGIDFDTTSISLVDSDGNTFEGILDDNDRDSVELRLVNPISAANGSQDGEYTVTVNYSDKAGNSETQTFSLIYDTQVPSVSSMTPEHGTIITQPDFHEVVIVLKEDTSGIDFAATEISLSKQDGSSVSFSRSNDGDRTIILDFDAFATDGSDDGEYMVEIIPVDSAQNTGATVTRRFFYSSDIPEIKLTNLQEKEFVSDISEISFQMSNYFGPEIDLDKSTVVVTKKGVQEPIAGDIEDGQDFQIIWQSDSPVPDDGTADGIYTVDVAFINQNNQKFEDSFEVTLDTKFPTIASTIPATKSQVESALDMVEVKLVDNISGVDVRATEVQLTGQNGTIPTKKSDNGVDTVILSFDQLKTDGSQDGVYTIEVIPVDVAGNSSPEPLLREFTYLSQKPEITLNIDEYTNQMDVIEAQLNRYSGPSINFDASTIVIEKSGSEIAGETDFSGDILNWKPLSPLSRDGSDDGEYSVKVNFFDSFDNSHTSSFDVKFDTQVPTIQNTIPKRGSRISELSQIKVTLTDNESGVDFAETNVRLIGPEGEVEATKTNDSQSIYLSFTPLKPEQDTGAYTIEVVPVDLASNSGSPYRVEFVFAEEQEIASIIPANKSTVNRLSSIEVNLADYTSEIVDFENSKITLTNPQGEVVFDPDEEINLISGRMSDDSESTLRLQLNLPTDGTADGKYIVGLNIADKFNAATKYTTTFVYDTQAPQATLISPENATVNIALPVIKVEAKDKPAPDSSQVGVNLVDSEIRLISQGEEIAGAQAITDNMITFVPDEQLPRTGQYTIEAILVDRVNNTKTYRYQFDYVINPPRVVSVVSPSSSNFGRIYVNSLEKIVVELKDNSGTGLDFSSSGSDIQVTAPDGSTLGGIKEHDGDNLVFNLTTVLDKRDGTDDGTYTVTVTPVDNTGTEGTPQRFSLVYDTQEPEISSLSHVDLFADVSYVSAEISRIEAQLQDEGGSDIDFDNSKISLKNEDGTELSGTVNNNELDRIWLSLDSILSRDGSSDGSYNIEVQILDKAGNQFTKNYPIVYDTQAPTAIMSKPEDEAVVVQEIGEVVVEINDQLSGADLSTSSLEIIGPNDIVQANKNNGVSILIYTFSPLRRDGEDDGRYLVNVTANDRAGNTSQMSFRFFYIAQGPKTISTTPAAGDYVNQLDTVSVTFSREVELNNFEVTLLSPDGSEVAGSSDREENTIVYEFDSSLPTDGSADGEYTINITSAGTSESTIYQQKFVYDTQIPETVWVKPAISEDLVIENRAVSISESFSEFTVGLTDANTRTNQPVSGLDLAGTQVQFVAPDGSIVDGNKRDNGVDEIIYSFPTLIKVGTYTIKVMPRDLAGNSSEHWQEFRFSLDFERPVVTDVSIGGETPSNYITSLTVEAKIEDRSGTGIDLTSSTVRVSGSQGEVEGVQSSDVETNTIRWEPVFLATDGSDDGTYTITVIPVDNAGRTGTQRRYTVVYDTQEPKVISVYPVDLASSVTYVGEQIRHVEATIEDTGPSEINIEEQRISLKDSSGNTVPGVLTDDGEQRVIWTLESPLATDGSDDGEYSVSLYVQDKAGNAKSKEYELVYDTQAPELVNTVPEDKAVVKTDLKKIEVRLEEPGGKEIDFEASHIELIDPKGEKIPEVEQTNNGLDTMTLRIDGLETDGTHIIRIYAVDKAGNGADTPVERKFLYSTSIPIVVSTTPKTIPPEDAYVNELTQVEATLQEVADGGIDFSSTGSEIRLLDSSGNVVAGTQIAEENNDKIVWELASPLATDGSEDGEYTITVVPVNKAGNRGDMKTFTFFYDTVVPEVEDITLQLVEGSNSLNTVSAIVSDDVPGSGIDWEQAEEAKRDEKWMKLVDSSGREYPGSIRVDQETKTVIFRLREPLASDGSQDGTYTAIVIPRDKAENTAEPTEYEFVYDTEAPRIVPDSLTINDKPLIYDTSNPDYPTPTNMKNGVTITAKVTDNGLGVDLAQSSILVVSPQGTPISGKVTHNGVDTLKLSTELLPEDGIYRTTVTAVGLDEEELGIRPSSTLSTTFLLETVDPTATLTDYGTKTTLEDEELPLQGTANDPESPETGVPASGVALVEIGGIGPDGEPIEWIPAEDESREEEEPWSSWVLDFLPAKSGEYELQIRVTDEAGNIAVFDAVDVNFTVSLGFKGDTYVWPNPLSRSKGDQGHFSFDVNIPAGSKADVTLYIYDVAGDLVYQSESYSVEKGRKDQIVTWNLRNDSDYYVASGIYVFRLEVQDDSDQTANKVGRILVVR